MASWNTQGKIWCCKKWSPMSWISMECSFGFGWDNCNYFSPCLCAICLFVLLFAGTTVTSFHLVCALTRRAPEPWRQWTFACRRCAERHSTAPSPSATRVARQSILVIRLDHFPCVFIENTLKHGNNCERAQFGKDLGFGCSGNIVKWSGVWWGWGEEINQKKEGFARFR